MTKRMRPGRHALVALSAVVTAGVCWASPAVAALDDVPGGALYKGKGTELETAPDASTVTINSVPVRIKCKGITPTNLGEDLGPFPIKKNGSFTNGVKKVKPGSGGVVLKGKFSRNGEKVSGTIEEAAFKDPAKDFDCPAYKGKWSAKHVKGTGGRPGEVLARDDFSDPDSGFETFNSENTFAEYLDDGRYRVGLRGPGLAVALRDEPNAANVAVKATVRWYGNDAQDGAGLVCQADRPGSFTAALIRGDGRVLMTRYLDGESYESAPASVPAGTLKSGQGEANELELSCAPDLVEVATHIVFSVNGEVVVRADTTTIGTGKTGFAASDSAGGTDFNFDDYVARVPQPDA